MSYTILIDRNFIINTYKLKKDLSAKGVIKYYEENWQIIDPNPSFNTKYFLEKNKLQIESIDCSALEYFWKNCNTEYLDPNPLFDTKFYLQSYKDIKKSKTNPLLHYLTYGYKENRKPHYLFDKQYLSEQVQKKESDIKADNLYQEYLLGEYKNFSCTPIFDSKYYLEQVDIPDNEIPIIHYLVEGTKKGFFPNRFIGQTKWSIETLLEDKKCQFEKTCEWFDPAWYKNTYLANYDFINPLKHFLLFGINEGKQPVPNLFPEIIQAIHKNEQKNSHENISALIAEIQGGRISKFYNTQNPEVSIVILNWNKTHTTAQCVAMLHQYTEKQFEIIVVDNGSEFSEFINLQKLCGGRSKIIRLKSNKFFGEANNLGVEEAKGKYIMLLNNDAFVTPNWLSPLYEELTKNEEIGLVGPKFLFPNGQLQEAGGIMSACGQGIQIGKFLDPDSPAFQIKREVDYCSAAAVLCRKNDYLDILGFDLIYEPAYYEDGDFCMKIKQKGKKIIFQPESVVYHVENHTSKDDNIGFSFNSLVSVNKLKFINRWSEFIAKGHPVDKSKHNFIQFFNISNDSTLPVAVLYTPYNVMPGGGEKYLLTIAQTLTTSYRVFLVTPEKISKIRILTVGNELNIDTSEITPIAFDDIFNLEIELMLVMGNEIFPSVPALGKKNIYHCQFPFSLQPGQENNIKFFSGYDKIIVNSKFTKAHIKEQTKLYNIQDIPVNILYPPINNITEILEKQNTDIIHILNVGRFFTGGHQKRQDVVIEAFKILTKKLPEKKLKLTLAGAVSSEQAHIDYLDSLRSRSKNYDVEFLINPTNDQLVDRYRNANLYVHATGYGANEDEKPEIFEHFGITVVEAALYNNIVFAYEGGGPKEIINEFPEIGATYKDMDHLVDLMENFISSNSRQNNSDTLKKLLNKYSIESFKSTFLNYINEANILTYS